MSHVCPQCDSPKTHGRSKIQAIGDADGSSQERTNARQGNQEEGDLSGSPAEQAVLHVAPCQPAAQEQAPAASHEPCALHVEAATQNCTHKRL